MERLKDVIITVSSFPELYIGKPSLERLYAFIGGYLHNNSEGDDHCLDGFNEYVSAKYRINSDHNWAAIINFFSSNEDEAFETFKALFCDYLEKNSM